MCTVHICFPALDLWSTVELQREQRKAALQQMVLLKELRWNSLCYKCSLVFFETPIGSGSPAGLRSNVLRPNECTGMPTHKYTLGYLMNGLTCLLALIYWTNWVPVKDNELALEMFWNQPVIIGLVIWHLGWLHWDYEFSLTIQYKMK